MREVRSQVNWDSCCLQPVLLLDLEIYGDFRILQRSMAAAFFY